MVMFGCSGSYSEYLPTGSEQPLRLRRIVGLNNSLKNDRNFKVCKIFFILRQLAVNLIHGLFPKEKHNDLLPAATKLGQGNIFTSVCQEFCPQVGGRVSASVHAGIPPRSRPHHPPQADTPPGSRPPHQEQTPPRSRPPQEQTPPPGSRLQHTVN